MRALPALQARDADRVRRRPGARRRSCSSASSRAIRRIWQGKPFVGPAGQLFDRALAEAGIDRARVYVTNAVKHFKFEPRGKRRIHKKPNNAEIEACRWWLDNELHLLKPQLTVALGATAARASTGRDTTISRARGKLMPLRDGVEGFITVHPSFLLRLPDAASKEREYRALRRRPEAGGKAPAGDQATSRP